MTAGRQGATFAVGSTHQTGGRYMDRMWVTEAKKCGPLAHTNLRCRRLNRSNINVLDTVPVKEVGGQYVAMSPGEEITVYLCDACPPSGLNWMDEAACRDTSEDFFTFQVAEQERLISEYCNVCPVKVECRQFAANDPDTRFGIWGGEVVR